MRHAARTIGRPCRLKIRPFSDYNLKVCADQPRTLAPTSFTPFIRRTPPVGRCREASCALRRLRVSTAQGRQASDRRASTQRGARAAG
ncbi:hypothetical protein BVI434_1040052 [Burkholderia vietnamiensis]|nr:hypothetical protein BVI434_1040052 [Burkholderia vietnamiensis]